MERSLSRFSIGDYLASLGVSEYLPLMEQNHITLSLLDQLSESDLKEIGIPSLGHRRIIVSKLSKFITDQTKKESLIKAELAQITQKQQQEIISPAEMDPEAPQRDTENAEEVGSDEPQIDTEIDWPKSRRRIFIFLWFFGMVLLLIVWGVNN